MVINAIASVNPWRHERPAFLAGRGSSGTLVRVTASSRVRWRAIALASSLAAACLAPTAGGAAPPAGDADPTWVGRYCRASTGSAVGDAIGFAAAAGAAVALARRRRA